MYVPVFITACSVLGVEMWVPRWLVQDVCASIYHCLQCVGGGNVGAKMVGIPLLLLR